MQLTNRHFYLFSATHSLLIGLLPFFIPMLILKAGANLTQFSIFISLTGVGFIATLWLWDRLREKRQWKRIIALSFALEMLLVWLLLNNTQLSSFVLLALINGAYNCFYWSTQRAIFSHITSSINTGKTFGNFQILVVIALKIGILAGAYLLENANTQYLLPISLAIASLSTWALIAKQNTPSTITRESTVIGENREPSLSITDILRFKDRSNSRGIFLIDGIFLFLESHFWLLSLYSLTNRNFLTLGVVIVSLTALLSVIFYALKNKIDHSNKNRVFYVAVILYAVSWLLRGEIIHLDGNIPLYATIVVIGFFTTFFRLTFNKRFFDFAKHNQAYQYLIQKSYFSQIGIVVFFAVLAVLFHSSKISEPSLIISTLSQVYLWAIPCAFIYLFYSNPQSSLRTGGALSFQTIFNYISRPNFITKLSSQLNKYAVKR